MEGYREALRDAALVARSSRDSSGEIRLTAGEIAKKIETLPVPEPYEKPRGWYKNGKEPLPKDLRVLWAVPVPLRYSMKEVFFRTSEVPEPHPGDWCWITDGLIKVGARLVGSAQGLKAKLFWESVTEIR
jgi:hypothetical protein